MRVENMKKIVKIISGLVGRWRFGLLCGRVAAKVHRALERTGGKK